MRFLSTFLCTLLLLVAGVSSCVAPSPDSGPYFDDAGLDGDSGVKVARQQQALQTGLCGNMAGLQANSPWPMRGGCPTHAAQSSAYGPVTATENWEHDFLWDVRTSPAIAADGTIYIGSDDGYFYALNPTTGATQWRFLVWDHIRSSPAIGADGTIYIGSNENRLHAFNPVTRQEKWAYVTGSAFANAAVTASPVIGADGTIYVGSHNGKFYAINPNGTKKWEHATAAAIQSSAAIGRDNTIYFGSDDNWLYALNPNGTLKWKRDLLDDVGSPAVGPFGHLYVNCSNGKLHALDAETGTPLWERYLGWFGGWNTPAIDKNGVVYIGGGDWTLYAYTPDGVELWKYVTLGPIISSATIDRAGNVYFGSDDDGVYALSPAGELLWHFQTWNNVQGSPVLTANGAVLIGSDDNKLHSLGVGGPPPKQAGELCAKDDECGPGLLCGEENGDRFGHAAGTRACWPASCQNGFKDVDEDKVDCGGQCGACDNVCARPCALGEQVLPDALDTLSFDSGYFIRGSLATYTDHEGNIQRATAHQLRYIGIENNKRMALFEGERTNTVIRSEELGTIPGWFVPDFLSGTPIQLQINAGNAPDGVTSADKLLAPSGGIPATIQLAANPNGPGTLSAYLKNAAAAPGKTRLILFDPIVSDMYSDAEAWDLPAEWTRFDKDTEPTSIPLYLAASHVANYPAGLGDLIPTLPAADYYLWGIQWEQGSFPSSYLPTNDQPRKRNADRLIYPASQVPNWMRTSMWQFDVMPLHASEELADGEEFVLFSFGGADDVIALVKQGGAGHLQVKAGGVVRFNAVLAWEREQRMTVTVDPASGTVQVAGVELADPSAAQAFLFPPGGLRVGGVYGGASEAFAALSEPRTVESQTVECTADPDCVRCGDGVVSGGEVCDPGSDFLCDDECSARLEDPRICVEDSDCANGQICRADAGSPYLLSSALDLCVPWGCPGSSCGTIDDTCGLCMCTPNCAGKACGDDLDDGCGGLCPVACGSRECGCEHDWQCPSGERCLVRRGENFGCSAGIGVCAPEVCDDFPRDASRCGEVTSECGLCPDVAPLCAGLECGSDEDGRPCPDTCDEGELCIENHCVLPALQKHANPIVPEKSVPKVQDSSNVGAIPAVFRVNEAGHAVYSIDIEAPPGFNGMQPKLSLEYSSGAGNGYAGLGWTVRGFGLSVIQRCAKNYAEDGVWEPPQFGEHGDEQDALCLHGRRLRVVREDEDEIEYRTVPDTFAKIIGHKASGYHGPVSLTMYAKDGTIHTYGGELPSCPSVSPSWDPLVGEAQCNNSRVYRNFSPTPSSPMSIRAWALSSIKDRADNELKVYYASSGACSDSEQCGVEELLPGYIYYSGGGWASFQYSGGRRDPVSGYRNGTPTRKTRLLQKIVTGSTAGGPYRSYWLTYSDADPVGNQLPAHYPSLLSEVHACASDGGTMDSLACFPPTTFDYDGRSVRAVGFDDPVALAQDVESSYQRRFMVLDYDGDGRDDLLVFLYDLTKQVSSSGDPGDAYQVRLYHSYHYTFEGGIFFDWIDPEVGSDIPLFDIYQQFMVQSVVDLDSDGKDDLLVFEGYTPETWTFLTWNGTRFVRHPSFPGELHDSPVVFDVDGDGEKDLLFCESSEQWRFRRQVAGVVSENEISFPAPLSEAGFGLKCPGARKWGKSPQPPVRDLDGDGRLDLLVAAYGQDPEGRSIEFPGMVKFEYDYDSSTVEARLERYGSLPTSGYWFPAPHSVSESSPFGDFNGDGYAEPINSINTGGLGLQPLVNDIDVEDELTLVVDYDGDGRDDIVDPFYGHRAFFEGSFRIREDSPIEYYPRTTVNPATLPPGAALGTADFNGDGIREVVGISGGPHEDALMIWDAKSRPRRLTRVIDGLGNEIAVEYPNDPVAFHRSEGSPDWYYKPTTCSVPCVTAKPPKAVVTRVTHKHGGDERDTYYEYAGLHRDLQRGATIGFESRIEEERRPQGLLASEEPARTWRVKRYAHVHSAPVQDADVHTPGHGGGFFTASRPIFEAEFHVLLGSELTDSASVAEGTIGVWSWALRNSSAGVPFVYSDTFYRFIVDGTSPTVFRADQGIDDFGAFAQTQRELMRTDTVDAYGNRTSSRTEWLDGTVTHQRARFLDPAQRPQEWQIGLKDRDWFSWSKTRDGFEDYRQYRRASYEYDDRGFLFATTREPILTAWDLEGQPGDATERMLETRAIHELRVEHDVDDRGRGRAVSEIYGKEMRQTRLRFADHELRVHPESSFDALGFETVLDFDRNSGQLLFTSHPDGSWQQNIYDALGRLYAVKQPEGTTTIRVSGALPSSVSVEGEDDLVVDARYAKHVTRPNGESEITLYNGMNQPVKRSWLGPDGTRSSSEAVYDIYGSLVRETGPHESQSSAHSSTQHFYDGIGRRRLTVAPAPGTGSRQTKLYYANERDLTDDFASLVSSLRQPSPPDHTIMLQIDPEENQQLTVTGARGQVVAHGNWHGAWSSFIYGPFDMRQLAVLHDTTGVAVTETRYSPHGWLLSMTDPTSGTSSYTYTHFGEVSTHTDALGRTAALHYDALGRTTRREDTDGVTRWVWDCLDQEREPDGSCAEGAPQAGFGKLVWTSSPEGHEQGFNYYPATGKLANETHAIATGAGYEYLSFAYAYDSAGQLEYLHYPDVGTESPLVRYQYNHGHVTAVERVLPDDSTVPIWKRGVEITGVRESFEYGNGVISLREQEPRSGDLAVLANWRATAGIDVHDVGSGTYDAQLLSRWDVAFDGNGNLREHRRRGDGFTTLLTYDPLDRLVFEHQRNDGSETLELVASYSYDGLGNLTSKPGVGTYTYEPGRPYVLKTAGSNSFEHDAVGNPFHREGDDIAGQVQDITYTATNLVRSIALGEEDEPSIRYEYNARGERVWSQELERTTLHAGRLYERIDEPSGRTHRFRIVVDGVPVAEIDNDGVEFGRYFHMDWRRTPALVTNLDGTMGGTPRFDAFGSQIEGNLPGGIGFTSHRAPSSATGLIDAGARHYDPLLGRFLNADPLVYAGQASQGYNRYAYVLNNPHKFIDPLGLYPCGAASDDEYVVCADPIEDSEVVVWEGGDSGYEGGSPGISDLEASRGDSAGPLSPGQGGHQLLNEMFSKDKLGSEEWQEFAELLNDANMLAAQSLIPVPTRLLASLLAKMGLTKAAASLLRAAFAARALPSVSRVARLTQEGVEHIAVRHFPTSGASGAGKFATSSLRELRSLINEAVKRGAVRGNTRGRPGNIFEYDFGRQIGTNIAGDAATRLRVVVTPDGVVKTAFPF